MDSAVRCVTTMDQELVDHRSSCPNVALFSRSQRWAGGWSGARWFTGTTSQQQHSQVCGRRNTFELGNLLLLQQPCGYISVMRQEANTRQETEPV